MSRARRSTTADTPVLDNLECLILAQAVWELGADSWPAVVKVLQKHPLISRPKSFFTPQVSNVVCFLTLNVLSCIVPVMSYHI